MKKLFFFYFTILFILFSCSKGSTENPEEPKSEEPDKEEPITDEENTYFTIRVPEDYFSIITENWVVSHDVNNGNILDYARLKNGSEITLKTNTSSLVTEHNISIVNVELRDSLNKYKITSYTSVEPNAIWQLGEDGLKYNYNVSPIGKLTFNAVNLDSPASWILSNKYGTTLLASQSLTRSENLTDISIDSLPVFQENRYLLSIYDVYGNGKYLFIDNLSNATTITVNSEQMKDFDKTIPLSIPEVGEYHVSVFGFEDTEEFAEQGGHILALIFNTVNDEIIADTLNVGYLDAFDKYITYFVYTKDNIKYSYRKYGDPPTGLSGTGVEGWSLEVIDSSVNNFQFNVISPKTFSQQSHFWSAFSDSEDVGSNYTDWTINQGNSYKTFYFKLPEEILTTYPQMDIEGLNYQNSTFHFNAYDYQEFLNASFAQPNPEMLHDHEFYLISQ